MTWSFDNPEFIITGDGVERLTATMQLVPNFKAKGWCISKNRFVMFWAEHQEMTPFPVLMGPKDCAAIVIHWLKDADYGSIPDIDGDVIAGWRCYTESWGHIENFGYQAFLAVHPYYTLYGK